MSKTIDNPTSISEVQDRKRRLATMRLSVWEGAIALIAFGLQQTFYIPFLNTLGASKMQVGICAGLPSLVTGLIQLGVPRWLENTTNYRKVLLISSILHGVSFVPMALLTYWDSPHSAWYAAVFMAFCAGSFGFGAGCWADWMGHLVPRRRRGKYFARRNRIQNLVQLAMVTLAGQMLDTFAGKTLLVFSLIWWAAFLTRTGSALLFIWHYEPVAMKHLPRHTISFRDFCAGLPSSPFGRFVLASSLLHLGANFSGPFFALYMLNDLKMSYMEFTILTLTPSLLTIVSMGLWGRVCDRFGYVIPMRLQALGVLGLPLVWIVTQHFAALLAVQIMAGLMWGGMTLSSFGYSIGALEGGKRLSYLSYLNCIMSVCIFVGTTLGGLLGPHLPPLNGTTFHSIFLSSTLMRIVPVLMFQRIPQDGPPSKKMSTLERFFFDPQLSLRVGFDRILSGRSRRPL